MRLMLKPWQHALASLALTAGVLACLYLLLIWPATHIQTGNKARIEILEQQLLRLRQAQQSITELERAIKAFNSLPEEDTQFMAATQPAVAATELQRRLKSIITRHQGHLLSRQPILDESQSSISRIAVKVVMRGDMNTLQGLLHDIASTKPRLAVDKLVVQHGPGSRHTTVKDELQLDIRFELSAYLDKRMAAQQ